MKIGYIYAPGGSVSKQKEAVYGAGCTDVFIDTEESRPRLKQAVKAMTKKSFLIVPSLANIGDTIPAIASIVQQMHEYKLYIYSVQEEINTKSDDLSVFFRICSSLFTQLQSRRYKLFDEKFKITSMRRRKRKVGSLKQLMAMKITGNKSDRELAFQFNCSTKTIQRAKEEYRRTEIQKIRGQLIEANRTEGGEQEDI